MRSLTIILGLLLAGTSPVWALPAVQINNGLAAVGLFGSDATAGFSFTTSQSVTVIALDAIEPGTVRLYNSLGTILATAAVTGTEPVDDTFFIHTIVGTSLAANQTYYVAEDLPSPGGFLFGAPYIGIDPRITVGTGVFSAGLGGTPTTPSQDPFFGPDFNLAAVVVPEPGTLPLIVGGLFALFSTRRLKALSHPTQQA